jgi:DNA-binding MarR family transcriptional regulator
MDLSAFHGSIDRNLKLGHALLQRLSDEVGRVAATLAQISAGPEEPEQRTPTLEDDETSAVSLNMVRQAIHVRKMRAQYFDRALLSDPAWDMLLDLLRAEILQERVSVSSLCIAADVPPSTALRWIQSMTDAGLLQRRPDPYDLRRTFMELSPSASTCLRRYFKEIVAQIATLKEGK